MTRFFFPSGWRESLGQLFSSCVQNMFSSLILWETSYSEWVECLAPRDSILCCKIQILTLSYLRTRPLKCSNIVVMEVSRRGSICFCIAIPQRGVWALMMHAHSCTNTPSPWNMVSHQSHWYSPACVCIYKTDCEIVFSFFLMQCLPFVLFSDPYICLSFSRTW